MADFTVEEAKKILEEGASEAQELIQDPAKMQDLFGQIQTSLEGFPVNGTAFSNVPAMVSMVKSYINKEYTEVSPNLIVSLVSAFLYLVKKRDVIPDNIPMIGEDDDAVVIGLAFSLCVNELKAYSAWKDAKKTAEETE